MKRVLGLDIGTNSIGAALINLPEKFEDYGKVGKIEWMGSRIIPLDGDYLQKNLKVGHRLKQRLHRADKNAEQED